jgi:hypothetical protein
MWLLGHGCCATYLQSGDDAPGSSPAAFLWVGLLLSQLGGCFMWHSLTAAGILIRHLLGVAGLAIASPLLSQTLTGTPQQWWHGLIVLSLVAQAAWWAIQQPIGQPPTPRSPTRYSLFQWLIFSGWLALALSLARDWQGTTAELAAVILCFGGLSLLVAVHRFAYLQLFWPASEVLPGRRPSPSVRMWDRIGILAILAVIQFAVAWGLGHYYGDDPRGSWVWAMCLLAGLWPAVDVAFEKLVRVNATLNATGPSVLSQASVLPGPAAAANNC